MKISAFLLVGLLALSACGPASTSTTTAPQGDSPAPNTGIAPAGGPASLYKEVGIDFQFTPGSGNKVGSEVTFTCKVTVLEDGWHLYSARTDGDIGYNPTELILFADESKGIELLGTMAENATAIDHQDPQLGLVREFKEKEVTFTQQLKLTADGATLGGEFAVQYCRDGMCKFGKFPVAWAAKP
jgi:Disulphide bond corrector protein DsbC